MQVHISPAVLAVTAVGIAGVVATVVWTLGLESDCHNRWRDSGLTTRWKDWTCQVEAGAKFYPEQAIKIHWRLPLPDPSP